MRSLLSFAIVLASVPVFPATAQQALPARCAVLAKQWDDIEKSMAQRMSDELTDNSVPRASLRKLEDIEALNRAALLYQMIKDNKCPLPDAPPSPGPYLSAALSCSTETLRQRTSDVAECKRDTWVKKDR